MNWQERVHTHCNCGALCHAGEGKVSPQGWKMTTQQKPAKVSPAVLCCRSYSDNLEDLTDSNYMYVTLYISRVYHFRLQTRR